MLGILMTTFILLTHGGTLSVIKDLTPKECKALSCKMHQQQSCMPFLCDADGNEVWPKDGPQSCSGSAGPSTPEHFECAD
jgi:hypothetical protein